MRAPLIIGLFVCVGCGEKIDHPAAAPECDPTLTRCTSTSAPPSGQVGVGDGSEGGAASSGEEVADWSGQVLAYRDDFFDSGVTFTGTAQVSATGESGARVTADYDGTSFELKSVLKTASNWFMVAPKADTGVVPTLTSVDTRVVKALGIGAAREQDLDGIFVLSSGTERSTSRAQIVVHVVDDQLRAVSGVQASLTAEFVAYRLQGTWTVTEGAATDDSGMLFLANVPASQALSSANIIFAGAVNAQVEAKIMAGATTVLTAIVSSP